MQVRTLYQCAKCGKTSDALKCWLRLDQFRRAPLCEECLKKLKEAKKRISDGSTET